MTTRETRPKTRTKAHATVEDPLLTLTEVARQLGRSPQTVKRWAADGLLRYVRLPSGLLAVHRSEINKFLGSTPINAEVE